MAEPGGSSWERRFLGFRLGVGRLPPLRQQEEPSHSLAAPPALLLAPDYFRDLHPGRGCMSVCLCVNMGVCVCSLVCVWRHQYLDVDGFPGPRAEAYHGRHQ